MTRARAGLGEEKTGPAPGQSTQIHTSRLLDPCKPKGLWLNITRGMASAGAWMFFGSNTHLFSLESQRMEDPQPALQQQGHEKGFSWENSYHSISQLGRLPFKPLRLGGSAQRSPAGRGPQTGRLRWDSAVLVAPFPRAAGESFTGLWSGVRRHQACP